MRKNYYRIILSSFLLSACGSYQSTPQQDYADAINRYAINGIYPPREAVFLGDIYLTWSTIQCRQSRKNPDCKSESIKLGSIPANIIKDSLNRTYGNTWSFKSQRCTVEIEETKSGQNTIRRLKYSDDCNNRDEIPNPSTHISLKRIAFPLLYVKESSDKGAIAALPGKLMARLGIEANSVEEKSISLPQAQYYGISLLEIQKGINGLTDEFYKNAQLSWQYSEQRCKDCDKIISVPYEIYYSRIFDITYKGSFSREIAFNRTRDGGDERTFFTPTVNSEHTLDAIQTTVREARDFGYAASLKYANEHAMAIQQTYDVPLAVGYQGLEFKTIN